MGETVHVQHYERMNPLHLSNESLHSDIKNVKDRDCIVAFSRADIYYIKKLVETSTNRKCCVIYGSLPPETRTEQADLFNDLNSGYNVLVASDAIGMGLNLNIKRIVFWKLSKFDPRRMGRQAIEQTLIKQIAGRAGRRGFFESGEVTTFNHSDHDTVKHALSKPTTKVEKAGIWPEYEFLQHFASKFSADTPVSHVLEKFFYLSRVLPDYFVCEYTTTMMLARFVFFGNILNFFQSIGSFTHGIAPQV